ncbi:hypothetical protein GOP47_0015885 [Adiantum capillus-veneris]|uniref:Reverse transcriptase domain-containing protein n=1 Tax=Adiantum capillus-veneris TaxID=13818 RepID=A0A9D4UL44_ADICA|nr:hypothetical protein GOP47_0015885 [Adiantum capillus-veneris]
MDHMGFGLELIHFVRTLFGNARATIAINNSLSDAFELNKSVRQGCCLAPLLFAIALYGINWLINRYTDQGLIEGIRLPHSGKQQVLSQFADYTNVLLKKENISSGRILIHFVWLLD